ncbi:MAG: pyridoxamine kinase [Mailhella sp.]|nr:pyridoxamine kinase [Mailhella sp.]
MDDIHNNQKKIALINDFSGFGRCSIAVQQPVMSMMRVQCCPVPTSIFSNHTGFPQFQCSDFTESMPGYIAMWEKLRLRFNGICTGFLGSSRQIGIVGDFIRSFRSEETVVLVDPVMGDYGSLYPTYTEELCREMRRLVELADIVTPNLTEACFLAGVPYRERWKMTELIELSDRIADLGASRIVITGIPQKTFLCNLCFDKTRSDSPIRMLKTHKIGTSRSGTGDIFSAILAADAVNGVPLDASVRKASLFIRRCILKAIEMDIPVTDGAPFEEVLHQLPWK